MADAEVEVQITPERNLSTVSEEETLVLVTVRPPVGIARQPVNLCCIIDISGSMGREATIQGASGEAESHGLTLLDVAKHGVRTLINSLGDQDQLSVISFNHESQDILPLTTMDEAGRKAAEEKVEALMQGGGTNIWQGLEKGLDSLRADPAAVKRFGHVMLLTDGETNERDSVVPNMLKYQQTHEALPGTVSTFGFGYNLDSQLLVDMAEKGSGSYSFIPDAGFVGTAFVNTLSNLLVTMAREAYLSLEPDSGAEITGAFEKVGDCFRVNLGTLQSGQTKDILVPMKIKDASGTYLCVSLQYQTASSAGKPVSPGCVEKKASDAWEASDGVTVQHHRGRTMFVDALREAVKLNPKNNCSEESLKQGHALVRAVSEQVAASSAAENEHTKALLEDVNGQTTEALSRQDWYLRWGVHYLPSLMCAHSLQQCNNFKDPGVQVYGGDLFHNEQEKADECFCKLPAPKPTASRRPSQMHSAAAAPVNMAMYNDRHGG